MNETERMVLVLAHTQRAGDDIKTLMSARNLDGVVVVTDVERAIELCVQRMVDVLVMDFGHYGVQKGAALSRHLRKRDDLANRVMPIILLAGHVTTELINTTTNAGIDEVLVRPFSVRRLRERVLSALIAPRPYITAPPDYFGPERRRKQDVFLPDDSNRRGRTEAERVIGFGPGRIILEELEPPNR